MGPRPAQTRRPFALHPHPAALTKRVDSGSTLQLKVTRASKLDADFQVTSEPGFALCCRMLASKLRKSDISHYGACLILDFGIGPARVSQFAAMAVKLGTDPKRIFDLDHTTGFLDGKMLTHRHALLATGSDVCRMQILKIEVLDSKMGRAVLPEFQFSSDVW